jgi:hypothetical protein
VRVLLDECVDWHLARALMDHEVKTARQMGWTGLKNGELLSLASRHFDAFVTVERNLAFQQETTRFGLAMMVLHARTNRLADLLPLVPKLLAAVESVESGAVAFVRGPAGSPY